MDMQSRNQYLRVLRTEYLKTKAKKERSALLNEAAKRTKLERKYLIKKLRPKSNLDTKPTGRKKRKPVYDGLVRAALARCWKIFDYACGQRLQPLLRDEIDRLRKLNELRCSEEVVTKLTRLSFRTIDTLLQHEKEVSRQQRKYHQKVHPLLYQKIPVKVFAEEDRKTEGHIQIDLVEHCGFSAAGEFVNTLSTTDTATGWWEGEAVMGKGQERVGNAIDTVRQRYPFRWTEIHSDNGTEFINHHLVRYTENEHLHFTRSRPYKKNDNCLVEQKNWTHVKKFVGYLRYDTEDEQSILNDLYRNEFRLYKNFFQPVMKLVRKERIAGKIRRRYDTPQTPYRRVLASPHVPPRTKRELTRIYRSLNPAALRETIEKKLDCLYKAYQKKQHRTVSSDAIKVATKKKQHPVTVSSFVAERRPVSVS
ncbi:MAG: transposase family protein [Patescibacteria group bacterium]